MLTINEVNMELIKPSEISARILTLLDESDERVILVSPYMKISKWYKFINKVNRLITRDITLEIYVRDDPDNTATYRDLDQLELRYKKLPHLHSKLYLNEKYGIVSSMNLLLSSEINSLEIGYVTETWAEYEDLLNFYHRYIHSGEPIQYDTIVGQPATNMKKFMLNIREEMLRNAKNSWLWLTENVLHIATGRNNYHVAVNDGYLRISVCKRLKCRIKMNSIQTSSLIREKVEDLSSMKIHMGPGPTPDSLHLSGQARRKLKSTCINGILAAEAAYIVESVSSFINATDDLVVH